MEAGEHPRWKVPSILLVPLIFCGLILFFIDFFEFEFYSVVPSMNHRLVEDDVFKIPKGFYIKTPGCRIPYMDPWDESIKQFIQKGKKPICNNGVPALFDYTYNGIKILNSSFRSYKIENLNELNCCFQEFIRIDPKKNEYDNKVKFGHCINFNESLDVIDAEFITVLCRYKNREIYKDFFSFVPVKETSFRSNDKLSVLILGIDAISRLNLHRQMPKTVDFLLNNLTAVEMFGYNKVADNTFPNLMPVLAGQTEEELKKNCWKNGKFDDCLFIWNNYSAEGYLTSFTEDASWMGLFNYQRLGFMTQPTNYYWSVFNQISEKKIGNSHNLNVYECVGARPVYKTVLDYTYRFINTMEQNKLPYFNLVWSSSLSHDYLNQPSIGDSSYLELLEKIKIEGYLNNTILIMMSDHGIRWGGIRQTYQGRMEERLPFLFFILPDWFKENNQQAYYNLLKNSRRLSTPFDLHETLKALIYPYDLQVSSNNNNRVESKRGYSLFSEISPKRTCKDAGISSHWCTCQQSLEVDKFDVFVKRSANFATRHINNQLQGYAQCAQLSLKEILNVRLMTHNNDIVENGDKGKDYMITMKTEPGEAVFEVTVRVQETKNRTYQFEVIGTISRLNLYGKQSACVTDFHLKLYCYCMELL